jgi:hypothetical protein
LQTDNILFIRNNCFAKKEQVKLKEAKFIAKEQERFTLTYNLNLIARLYTSKIVVLLSRKNDSAKTLNLYKRELRVLQVAKALFNKTLLLESNISPNKLEELILL